jgi:hypothetical protein
MTRRLRIAATRRIEKIVQELLHNFPWRRTCGSLDPATMQAMSLGSSRAQAVALRLVADPLDRGGALAPELADALANALANHPDEIEELAAADEHVGALPPWMATELERREREDAATEEDGDVVMGRLLAKHG